MINNNLVTIYFVKPFTMTWYVEKLWHYFVDHNYKQREENYSANKMYSRILTVLLTTSPTIFKNMAKDIVER